MAKLSDAERTIWTLREKLRLTAELAEEYRDIAVAQTRRAERAEKRLAQDKDEFENVLAERDHAEAQVAAVMALVDENSHVCPECGASCGNA